MAGGTASKQKSQRGFIWFGYGERPHLLFLSRKIDPMLLGWGNGTHRKANISGVVFQHALIQICSYMVGALFGLISYDIRAPTQVSGDVRVA